MPSSHEIKTHELCGIAQDVSLERISFVLVRENFPQFTDLVGFYLVIHELGSILSSRQKGAFKSCTR